MSQTISIAYSPDTDDAFMVHALKERLVDWRGYSFTFTSADIQELNEAARRGVYDVTAISIAAYPSMADDYLLMTIGASIGDEFGPAVVVRPDAPFQTLADLAHRRIAIPGRNTSAFYAARGLIGAFDDVPLYFKDIAGAVKRGEVDAGILIHELQLDCESDGLRKVDDLGRAWHRSHALPLPLGANAIRRALGERVVREVGELLKASIEHGLAARDSTLRAALASSGAHLDVALGDRYIDMYVNRRSLGFAPDVREAMRRLIGIGVEEGLCRPLTLDTCLAEV
jgi:1,4-dihydroxy-6-naphthoate synthase